MAGSLVTTNILQTLVDTSLVALRQRIVLAMNVNRSYEGYLTGAKPGATVNIQVPAAVAARTVSPDVVPPAVTAVTPTTVPVTLSQWYEAPFAMDDKAIAQVGQGLLPGQASEAIKSMANQIDSYIWSLTHGSGGFYGYTGLAGTTPFATDLNEFLTATNLSDQQLMPPAGRVVILDTFAKANALGVNAVQNAAWRGDANAFKTGIMGDILGASWDYSQNVPTHTSGTWSNAGTVSGSNSAGQKVVNLTGGTGSILVGDIVTFAGDSQTYSVDSFTGSAPTTQIVVTPALVVAHSSSEVVTVKASHKVNVLFHPLAIAFAMAPLQDETRIDGVPSMQATAIDEVSGLALRLEVTRQYKQTQWAFDALYGGAVVRPQFGVRIAG
jgi:P22 coat protein - gene protein 5